MKTDSSGMQADGHLGVLNAKNNGNLRPEPQQKLSAVPQQVFNILYKTSDISQAINQILGLLGEANDVSRVYVFEDSEDHLYCNNTFEWCAKGIKPQIENLQHLSYAVDLGGTYMDNFDENGVFFCSDIARLPKAQQNVLAPQEIVSVFQAAIVENGETKGFIGFDECSCCRKWTEEQKQSLLWTSQIISTSLFKLRHTEALQKSQQQLEEEHRRLQESEKRFQLITQSTPISVWDYDICNRKILQTQSSHRVYGENPVVEEVPEGLISAGLVHPESVEEFREMYQKLFRGEPQAEGIFRIRSPQRADWWYERIQYTNLPGKNGRPYKAIAISSDVTTAKLEGEKLRRIIDGVPGGLGIFEMVNHNIVMRYLNKGFYEMVGDNRENRQKFSSTNFWDAIYPEDLPRVKKTVRTLLEGIDHIDFKYRVLKGNGQYIWLRVLGNQRIGLDGRALVYCSFVNVDEYMGAMQVLQKNQVLFDTAMHGAKISTWEYDINTHTATLSPAAQAQHGLREVILGLPESLIASGYVHPNSAEDFRRLFCGKFPGKKPIQCDIQVQTPDQTGYWWGRYILSPIYDADGGLITVFGTSIDVTEQKRIQERYQKQIDDLEQMDSDNLIVKARYNITKNTKEYHYGKTGDAVEDEKIRDYTSGLQETAYLVVKESDRKQFLALFNAKTLLQNYSPSNSLISMEYQRKAMDGHVLWCLTQGKMIADPSTGDIILSVYSFDITEQKIAQQMMNAVVRLDYDYLALLDCRSKSYIIYSNAHSEADAVTPIRSTDYEGDVRAFIGKAVAAQEKERVIRELSIECICDQLKKSDRYSCYVNFIQAGGSVRRKLLQFSYIDRSNEKVLFTRIDVTDIYEKEQQKVKELQIARDAAEQARAAAEEASCVKTQFLSRMSHDLRTPMNAVIGLTELAKDEVADPLAMKKYITSISSAGKLLLNIVNDCLDLEKIAANKMTLNPAPYSYEDFKRSIGTIMEPLCRNKKISFVLGEDSVQDTVLIDPVRFEQIFMNLLTNSVKFTPEGGRVEFFIQNKAYHDNAVSCDFVVRDNGIGMSKVFQQHMFEPFEQESNEITPQSQGTGLGLSIVKTLVELMHGTICVNSEIGRGTEFVIHLDMSLVNPKKQSYMSGEESKHQFSQLAGKHVLLVEDHPLNTEIAKRLLEKQGVIVTCAANGKEGLDMFAASLPGVYQAVLMDVRMPLMNGLEAAEKMRALPRPDAATVPIIAMSANAFDVDIRKSTEVGMNAYIPKPIEPEKLYTTLSKWL